MWAFVGGSVNAVYRESNQPRSDILTVARFLHRVLSSSGWATDTIGRLLRSESGLRHPDNGGDIFADKFDYPRRRGSDAVGVYQDAVAKVMHTTGSSGLRICDLRGSDGELGLKAAGSDEYFGVINIGDTAAFKRLVEGDENDIVREWHCSGMTLFGNDIVREWHCY